MNCHWADITMTVTVSPANTVSSACQSFLQMLRISYLAAILQTCEVLKLAVNHNHWQHTLYRVCSLKMTLLSATDTVTSCNQQRLHKAQIAILIFGDTKSIIENHSYFQLHSHCQLTQNPQN